VCGFKRSGSRVCGWEGRRAVGWAQGQGSGREEGVKSSGVASSQQKPVSSRSQFLFSIYRYAIDMIKQEKRKKDEINTQITWLLNIWCFYFILFCFFIVFEFHGYASRGCKGDKAQGSAFHLNFDFYH